MHLDLDRLRTVIRAGHSYYGNRPPVRHDNRWHPFVTDLISREISPESRLLEVGCGNGAILLELSPHIRAGVGVDYDPSHIHLAEAAKREQGSQNVEFLLLDYPSEASRLEPESFDLVYDLRGPLAETDAGFQAARGLLKPGGLLFCESIGENHQKEKAAVFQPANSGGNLRVVEQLAAKMERNRFDVRLAADSYTKWIFQDIYAWVQSECDLRAWLGVPPLEPDDPRIGAFAEKNANAAGEIVTTHHVVWAAGIKA